MWRSLALPVDVTLWRTPLPSNRKFNDRDFIVMERFDGTGKDSIWPTVGLRSHRPSSANIGGRFAFDQTALYGQFAQRKSLQVKWLPSTCCKRREQLWFGSSFDRKMESRWIYRLIGAVKVEREHRHNRKLGRLSSRGNNVLLNNKTEKKTFKGSHYVVKYNSL